MRRAAALALLVGLGLAARAAAETEPLLDGVLLGAVEIPGTRVALDAPAGFEVAKGFAGLIHHLTGTTIVVRELDVGPERVAGWLERDPLDARGLRRTGAERIETRAGDALVVHADEDGDYIDRRHWMAVLGSGRESLLIVATAQDAFDSHMHRTVMAVIASTQWDRAQPLDPFAGLSWSLPQTKHLAWAPRVSEELLLLPRRQLGPLAGDAPRAVAREYALASEIDDLERFAVEHLASSDQTSTLEDVRGRKLRHEGRPAYEIVAGGADFERLAPLLLYQLLVLDKERFWVVQGFAPRADSTRWLARFRELARGFRLAP